ncbi:MAG: hypothetical protein ACXAAR_10510 [Candidatus Thorarchaeota archaeon]
MRVPVDKMAKFDGKTCFICGKYLLNNTSGDLAYLQLRRLSQTSTSYSLVQIVTRLLTSGAGMILEKSKSRKAGLGKRNGDWDVLVVVNSCQQPDQTELTGSGDTRFRVILMTS